jgi:uncharacterized damage-inducible protein DinB
MSPAWSMDPAVARKLVGYNDAVFHRFVRAAKRLPWREATRNRGSGHLSIFRTLVHILHVQEAWLVFIGPGRVNLLLREGLSRRRSPENWKEFDLYSRTVWARVHAFVDVLGPRSLGRVVKAPWMPGRYTLSDGIVQATIEQAHHLGEIIALLWQKDRAPPAMTWIEVTRRLDG